MSVETFNQDPSLTFLMALDEDGEHVLVRISAIAAVRAGSTSTVPGDSTSVLHLIGGDRVTLRLTVSEVVTLIRANQQATQQET